MPGKGVAGGATALVWDCLLGQLLSVLVTATTVFSEVLVRRGFNAPASQSTLNYLLLALVYGTVLVRRGDGISSKWYKYCVLAFFDVEANYLVILAYQFTSMTSVTLLDCTSIPIVMALSACFFRRRYERTHIVGVGVALFGIAALLMADATKSPTELRSSAGKLALQGDGLVLVAALLYAVSNMMEESLASSQSSVEVLARLGMFGTIINGGQLLLLERHELPKLVRWDMGITLPLVGFATALFCFYSLVPVFLRRRGAAALNLSLLTSDIMSALARVAWFDGFGSSRGVGGFAVALALVSAGLMIFYLAEASAAVDEVSGGSTTGSSPAPPRRSVERLGYNLLPGYSLLDTGNSQASHDEQLPVPIVVGCSEGNDNAPLPSTNV